MVRRVVGLVLAASVVVGCVEPPPPLAEPPTVEAPDLEIPEPAAESVARRAQEFTVRIRALGCVRFGVGSGFVLPGGIVATNRHVIDEPREVTVNTWDGVTFPTVVSGMAVDSDLALLQLAADVELPVAQLRVAPVTVGEPVIVVGYPGGGPATITSGTVLGLVDGEVLNEPTDVIRVDARVQPGNSGGPLLDEDGLVVGVIFAQEVGSERGLAVPIQTLLERIEQAAFEPPSGRC